MNLEYKVRKSNLLPYFNKAQKLKELFIMIEFRYVQRHQNVKIDALARVASSMSMPNDDKMEVEVVERKLLALLDTHRVVPDCFQVVESSVSSFENFFRDWRDLFINYILHDILPDNVKDRTSIQRRAPKYHFDLAFDTLYCKSYDGVLLYCLSQKEAEKPLKMYTQVCMVLIKQDLNYTIKLKG